MSRCALCEGSWDSGVCKHCGYVPDPLVSMVLRKLRDERNDAVHRLVEVSRKVDALVLLCTFLIGKVERAEEMEYQDKAVQRELARWKMDGLLEAANIAKALADSYHDAGQSPGSAQNAQIVAGIRTRVLDKVVSLICSRYDVLKTEVDMGEWEEEIGHEP